MIPRSRERGFALLIVLFTLVLLVFLISRFVADARTQLAIAGNLRNAAMAAVAADGGVDLTIARLADHAPATGMRIGASAVVIDITSIAGRINPNTAPAVLLAALLRVEGVTKSQALDIAGSIIDWRSPAASRAAQLALDARYRAEGLPYGPAGEPFTSRAALANVIGMTPTLLAAIMPHLSLFAPPLPVVASADPAVRAALGLAGRIDMPGGAVQGPQIVEIEAAAGGPGRARATRCALVRLSPANIETPYRVLRWRTGTCPQ